MKVLIVLLHEYKQQTLCLGAFKTEQAARAEMRERFGISVEVASFDELNEQMGNVEAPETVRGRLPACR